MAQQRCDPSVGAALKIVQIAIAFTSLACADTTEELARQERVNGNFGGWLQTAQRSEPRTFNPVTVVDTSSKDVIGQMHSDLIHINRSTLRPEPGLASSWTLSPNGLTYKLKLRRGIRFSDGHLMDADDVVFTFSVYLDEKSRSPQRDLLTIHGKPIQVRKTGTHTVEFELPAPYASAERLFDGVAILPRHLLLKSYREGTISQVWGIGTPPNEIAGLGPFRLKQFVPGQRAILERNPFFWKSDRDGRRLPYLEGLVFHVLPNEDLQVMKLLAGDLSAVERLSAGNFLELNRQQRSKKIRAYDAGPGLEYQFLVFNMNDAPAARADRKLIRRQAWFQDVRFRRAVSLAIDRRAISNIAYSRLAQPVWGHVTPGNTLWRDTSIPRPERSLEAARSFLRSASFSWNNHQLIDPEGHAVEFSLLVSAANTPRVKAATIIQDDLRQLGMKVSVVSLESRSMADRVFNQRDYDAAVMAIDSGDLDPNSEMSVWLTSGSMHLWNLSGQAKFPWEKELDGLMKRQMTLLDRDERKRIYDRVQQLTSEHLPFIFMTTPHVLVAASQALGNVAPSIIRSNLLWNAESLFFRASR